MFTAPLGKQLNEESNYSAAVLRRKVIRSLYYPRVEKRFHILSLEIARDDNYNIIRVFTLIVR